MLGYEGLIGAIGVAAVGIPLTMLLPGPDPGVRQKLLTFQLRCVAYRSNIYVSITVLGFLAIDHVIQQAWMSAL